MGSGPVPAPCPVGGRRLSGVHGWLILDKPRGLGSTQAVAAVKRVLREAGYGPRSKDMPKVGHGGTLDPLAEGVLPIALGEATKLAGRMLDSDKIYAFTVQFGEETDTLDTEGEVIATSEVRSGRAGPVAAVVAGGVAAIFVTLYWARLFPELRLAKTFDPPPQADTNKPQEALP